MKNGGNILSRFARTGAFQPIATSRGQLPHKGLSSFPGPRRKDDCPEIAEKKEIKKGTRVKLACDPGGPIFKVARIDRGRVYLKGLRGEKPSGWLSKSIHPNALTVVE